jgi:hypothetical protein
VDDFFPIFRAKTQAQAGHSCKIAPGRPSVLTLVIHYAIVRVQKVDNFSPFFAYAHP